MSNQISILKGTIYNENGGVVSQAIINIMQIDPQTKESINLGYTITDNDGLYTFPIDGQRDKIYEISIFPPPQT